MTIGKSRDINNLIFMLFLLLLHKNIKKSGPYKIKENEERLFNAQRSWWKEQEVKSTIPKIGVVK